MKINKLHAYFYAIVTLATLSLVSCQPKAGTSSDDSEVLTDLNSMGVIENVSVTEFDSLARALEGSSILLDVRSPEEWAQGIISGATLLNYYDDSFSQSLGNLPKSEFVLVYCKAGGRSSEAAEQLKNLGFKHIYNLEGGIDAWNEAGMAVSTNQ
jgi:phage shock protein E